MNKLAAYNFCYMIHKFDSFVNRDDQDKIK